MSKFRQCPVIYTLETVLKIPDGCDEMSPDDKVWYPARPLNPGWRFDRLRAAWLVWTGRADAFTWPGGQ